MDREALQIKEAMRMAGRIMLDASDIWNKTEEKSGHANVEKLVFI